MTCKYSGCFGLTFLVIPKSVTSIDHTTFWGCSGLSNIEVEEGNPVYDSREGCNAIIETASNTLVLGCKNTTFPTSVVGIGIDAFHDCIGLSTLTISETITNIGIGAFSGCKDLTSFTIPASVTSINDWTFENCTALSSIDIPTNVTTIGNAAFYGCTGLTSITIPNNVTEIGQYAFYSCTGLTSLSIGNGIQKIGENAFASTEELTDVYCFAENVPYDGWCAYKDSPIEYATLHVPENSLGQYKTTYPWSDFGNIVALTEEEITNIKDITTQSVRERYFDLSGKKLEAPIEGITIVVTEFEDGRQMVKRLVK